VAGSGWFDFGGGGGDLAQGGVDVVGVDVGGAGARGCSGLSAEGPGRKSASAAGADV